MSGSPGNTSSGGDRARAPRTDNSDITSRHDENEQTRALGSDVAGAADDTAHRANTKHQQPDDANAAARKEPGS
jgi:hypothetical protein